MVIDRILALREARLPDTIGGSARVSGKRIVSRYIRCQSAESPALCRPINSPGASNLKIR
jgi:hypothetical protein